MKAQSATDITTFNPKQGVRFLAEILTSVKSVEIVKPVTQHEVVSVSWGWKILWVVFWIVVFWPMAIIVTFIAGNRTNLVYTDGVYNVTLKDGYKFILSGNEDYLIAFASDAQNKSFLN